MFRVRQIIPGAYILVIQDVCVFNRPPGSRPLSQLSMFVCLLIGLQDPVPLASYAMWHILASRL